VFLAGVLTISDKGWRGERVDESGQFAQQYLKRLPVIKIGKYEIVPDDKEIISTKLKEWADDAGLDLIITSGGTGLAPRDITPEATMAVIDRLVPGLTEAMRMETKNNAPTAVLSRAIAGSRGKCLIVNLPGSPGGVRECLEVILPVIPHALETLAGKIFEGHHHGGGS
jgi:molybdenum cofactor synthesis domain-containing protein